MSSQIESSAAEDVAALIRKELRREANARLLRRMPTFHAEEEIPEKFKLLLLQLERAEARVRR